MEDELRPSVAVRVRPAFSSIGVVQPRRIGPHLFPLIIGHRFENVHPSVASRERDLEPSISIEVEDHLLAGCCVTGCRDVEYLCERIVANVLEHHESRDGAGERVD